MTPPCFFRTTLTACAALFASLFQVDPACAQDAAALGADTWRFSAGLGVISQPEYPGSKSTKTNVVPLLGINYGRFFIGGTPGSGVPLGLGALLVRDPHWRLGFSLGYDLEKPRKESDADRLRGLGDVPRTALGSVFGSYEDRWYAVLANVRTDIGGQHEGTTATLELEGRLPVDDRLTLTAGPSITWADTKFMQTFFGISSAQSASSGLPAYSAGSGLEALRLNVGANYRLTPNWGLGARVSVGSLRGDAGSSPITEKKQQNNFGLFANYRF